MIAPGGWSGVPWVIGYSGGMTQSVSAPRMGIRASEPGTGGMVAADAGSADAGPVDAVGSLVARDAMDALEPMEQAIAIMALLRSPEGCAWDREQTFDSIKRYTLEETYEVFDAIERRSWPELKDELGDLLLQVLFYAEMAKEAGYFDIRDVATGLNEKLVRRHPHVFADVEAADADAVLRNWEQIKRDEKRTAGKASASLLADVPRSMPAMTEAAKLGSGAAKVGFDWQDVGGLVDKLREETAELEVELQGSGKKQAAEEEMGDLLFTAVNLARHMGLDAEFALRGANAKFRRRFACMEEEAGGGAALAGCSPEKLEAMWMRAKGNESSGRAGEAHGTERGGGAGDEVLGS